MSKIQLKVDGLDKLAAKIKGAERDAARVLAKALQDGVTYIHQNIPPYPARSNSKMIFVSAKQRRWFFWALRKGELQLPYKRTMTLGRSFTTFRGGNEGALSEVESTATSLRAIVGTAIPYAHWVVGDDQARMHQGRWFKLTEEIEKHIPQVVRYLQTAINRLLGD